MGSRLVGDRVDTVTVGEIGFAAAKGVALGFPGWQHCHILSRSIVDRRESWLNLLSRVVAYAAP